MNNTIALIKPLTNNFLAPSLGLGYLSSVLKQQGYSTILIDAHRDNMGNDAVLQLLQKDEIHIAGITCMSAYYYETVVLSKILKKAGITVIIGGVHPTFMPYQTLVDSACDYVICGEGEIALPALIQKLTTPPPPPVPNEELSIKGVYSLRDLKNASTPFENAEAVHNLDELPFPDWDQMKPGSYPVNPQGFIYKKWPVGSIISSRGCAHKCTFCASPIFWGTRVKFRSPENVVEEIILLKEKHGVKEIQFTDDNLILKRNHVERICHLLIEKKVNLPWSCPNGIRADYVDDSLVKLMKKAGCYFVSVGVESADEQILKNIHKGESIDSIKNAIEILAHNGIICNGFFILGLPGDTKETIRKTIEFACSVPLTLANFNAFAVLPGCEVWRQSDGNAVKSTEISIYSVDYIPKGLTENYLNHQRKRGYWKFYFRVKIILKLMTILHLRQLTRIIKKMILHGLFKV